LGKEYRSLSSSLCNFLSIDRPLILMHAKHTISYLYVQTSSWRWTLGFETYRRHHKWKY
jgi:hypothetical protein